MLTVSLLKKIAFLLVGVFALIGVLFSLVFVGMQFGWFNVRGSSAERDRSFVLSANASSSTPTMPAQPCTDGSEKVCSWQQTTEWPVIAGGLTKDASIISRVSRETGVPARLIVSVVIPEQMRFFTSEREVFKRVFEPLKILGSMSQFSLGVSGVKQDTANSIEQYALDPASSFYIGSSTAALIAYPPGVDHDSTLYSRLTDQHDHYYSYLYTALYIREVEAQWQAAGYDISDRPGIIGTLFNIGFRNSSPGPSPVLGGAHITIGGATYVYGELTQDFYDSNELLDVFPRS